MQPTLFFLHAAQTGRSPEHLTFLNRQAAHAPMRDGLIEFEAKPAVLVSGDSKTGSEFCIKSGTIHGREQWLAPRVQ